MLTHNVTYPASNFAVRKTHVSHLDSLYNGLAFVATSTFTTFTSAANNLQQPWESTFTIPIDEAVFPKSNWDLYLAQHKLLLWHYRLGHIKMETVQRLLAKLHALTSLVPEH